MHGKASRLSSNEQSGHVKDDVLYEEYGVSQLFFFVRVRYDLYRAYNIVKKFLELSTYYSVESLQT